MIKPESQYHRYLNVFLVAGSIYFLIVAIVHFFGIKIPMLYIYYDIESYPYQDRIISALSMIFLFFCIPAQRILPGNITS